MKLDDILKDLEATNPDFFDQYEAMAQSFYSVLPRGVSNGIPKSHAKAMLMLLNMSGYMVIKRPSSDGNGDNVIKLRSYI